MFNRNTHTLQSVDREIWSAIENEHRRQEEHIELIASENYTGASRFGLKG